MSPMNLQTAVTGLVLPLMFVVTFLPLPLAIARSSIYQEEVGDRMRAKLLAAFESLDRQIDELTREKQHRRSQHHRRLATRSSSAAAVDDSALADSPLDDSALLADDDEDDAAVVDRDAPTVVCHDGCCRERLVVNLTDALVGFTVISPTRVDIGFCRAAGPVPCSSGRVHARLLRTVRPDLVHCMPVKYAHQAIVYRDRQTGAVGHTSLPSARVAQCGCA